MLDRWSEVLVRRPLVVLLAGVALTLAAGAYGAGVFGSLSQGGFDDPGSESAQALRLERDDVRQPRRRRVAIYSSDDLRAEDPEFRERVEATLAGLPQGHVTAGAHVVRHAAPDLLSQDGHSTQVLISLEGRPRTSTSTATTRSSRDLHAEGLDTDLAGTFAVFADVNERTEQDLAAGRDHLAAGGRDPGAADLRQPGGRRRCRCSSGPSPWSARLPWSGC